MNSIATANYGQTEIEIVLSQSRVFNTNIGHYVMHAINQNFNYSVKLSNGYIVLNMEELQDCNYLTNERLQVIAERFQLSQI